MNSTLAFLSDGKLYWKQGTADPQLVQSHFVQEMLDRAERDRQRQGWKSDGMAWRFSGMAGLMAGQLADPHTRRVRFTAVSGGDNGLIYALQSDTVGGLFAWDAADGYERRLLHRNQFRAADVARHPESKTLALSIQMDDGACNLATMEAEGRGLREITEGDSLDQAPAWVGRTGRKLVFQSAGLARNAAGFPTATGPYALMLLDLDADDMATLLESDAHDYLVPRMTEDRTLYFIRRPYQPDGASLSPIKALQDMLLFPFRLGRAIVHFCNWFSIVFSRKPLLTAGGPPKESADARYMMLWGKLIDAEKVLRGSKEGQASGLVPRTWELVRRAPDGTEEILAHHVLSFDLCADGSLFHTNGSAIFHRGLDGKTTQVCDNRLIERVVAVQA